VALPFGLVFVWGVLRLVRRVRGAGLGSEAPPPLGRVGLVRLVGQGILQRRLRAGPLAGRTHLAISTGFGVLLLGSLLILVDDHLLAPFGAGLPAGRFYQLFQAVLDLFGIALVAAAAAALLRRLRGRGRRPERPATHRVTAALLTVLLFLGLSGFVLEALRLGTEGGLAGSWAFAGRGLAALLALAELPEALRAGLLHSLWWTHAVVALGLVAAIPFTALRHLVVAPVHLWVASEAPRPAPRTPFDLRELLVGGALDVRVGVASADDVSWRDRLALAACTECGSCDLVCPAVASGSALAPRRLVRSLWRACSPSDLNGNGTGPRDLFESAVSPEEVWACTLCSACIEACPMLVRPPEAIVELRRELVTRNRLPPHGTELLVNLARCGNPYGLPHREREGLAAALGVSTLAEDPDVEVLYWLGCATAYDPRARRVAEAMVAVLRRAGVCFGVLGAEERCTGDAARRLGEEGRFQELALANLETFERYGVRRVVTHCAHCFDTLRNDYPELGGRFETVHHTAFLDELVRTGRLTPGAGPPRRATLHDACCACRFNGLGDEPRRVLAAVPGMETVEMPRSREEAFCCGGGGAGYWYETPHREPIAALRLAEAVGTGAQVLVVECPFCLRKLEDAATGATPPPGLAVRDVAEVVAESWG
jgi:Fe-S oxidoreductase/nitrate reductase gamma subunit